MKATVRLDASQVLAIAASRVSPHVAETTRMALNRMRVTAPKRTGRMANSLKMTMRARRTFVVGTITASPRYTHFVERGTRPHVIKARKKRALKFHGRGGIVIVRSVKHPGTKPRPFMFRSLVDVAVPRGYRVTRTVTVRTVG